MNADDEWEDFDLSSLSGADCDATESAMSLMDYMERDLAEDARVESELSEMAQKFGGA